MLLARGGPGDRERAIQLLDQALAMAEELGMGRWTEEMKELRQQAAGTSERITN